MNDWKRWIYQSIHQNYCIPYKSRMFNSTCPSNKTGTQFINLKKKNCSIQQILAERNQISNILTSKIIETKLRPNLTQLPVMPPKSFKSTESNTNCNKLNKPPVKSKIIFHIFHPTVDWRFTFNKTCGIYLTVVIVSLTNDSM